MVSEGARTIPPVLSPTAIRLYRHVVRHTVLPIEEATRAATGDEGEPADAAVESLLRLGLLRRVGRQRIAAVDPALSSMRVLHSHEQHLAEEKRRLAALRDQLHLLDSIHRAQGELDAPSQERLTSNRAVRETLNQLATSCAKEVLAAQPGGPRPADVLAEAADRDLDLLNRGVQLRSLYQHSARFDSATLWHATQLTSHGAEIRTLSSGLTRFLVFDRETVVLPLPDAPEGALVLRDPDLSSFAADVFEVLWAQGQPMGRCQDKPSIQGIGNQTKQAILRLLVQGSDDRGVARALGISVRTCQRHVSEIMTRVGAKSRLELGYLIRERNLLEP
ncbi:helix-turn-helix transcriptional regulator [Streptomyces sp. JJ38]|uniref:helix-turn-helix transcriptional regulator n=1 Tax=Streptomyces sp. JJ38 TaxID=2738128 RepID=UPI001C5947A2|nr:helix-turn-helix transcriptional regulator [Streptomyces sp. JJ38]MBW1597898.1 helix-turn-helix transcriptional regulator [Streptomyces sp. JJ38]